MVVTEIKRTEINSVYFAPLRWDSQYKHWQIPKTWQTNSGEFYKKSIDIG